MVVFNIDQQLTPESITLIPSDDGYIQITIFSNIKRYSNVILQEIAGEWECVVNLKDYGKMIGSIGFFKLHIATRTHLEIWSWGRESLISSLINHRSVNMGKTFHTVL